MLKITNFSDNIRVTPFTPRPLQHCELLAQRHAGHAANCCASFTRSRTTLTRRGAQHSASTTATLSRQHSVFTTPSYSSLTACADELAHRTASVLSTPDPPCSKALKRTARGVSSADCVHPWCPLRKTKCESARHPPSLFGRKTQPSAGPASRSAKQGRHGSPFLVGTALSGRCTRRTRFVKVWSAERRVCREAWAAAPVFDSQHLSSDAV